MHHQIVGERNQVVVILGLGMWQGANAQGFCKMHGHWHVQF